MKEKFINPNSNNRYQYFIIVLLISVFIAFFSFSVFADDSIDSPDFPNNYSASYYKGIMFYDGEGNFIAVACSFRWSAVDYYFINDSGSWYAKNYGSTNSCKYIKYRFVNNNWTKVSEYSIAPGTTIKVDNEGYSFLKKQTDFNIYDDSSRSNVCTNFPLPLIKHQLTGKLNSQQLIQGTMAEILELLPLILVLVVSLVGLRKALALLSTVLHQA